jgi:glycosyltransferase involved in cell wall biosynthesis
MSPCESVPGSNTVRIPLLLFASQLTEGGVEEIILQYAKMLNKGKYNVTVACFSAGIVFKEIRSLPNVSVVHINTASRLLRFVRLLKLARNTHARIVHDHSTWYGVIVGRLVGAKTIETIHNRFEWFNWHERIRFGLNCRLANRVIAVAESVKKFSVEHFPFLKPEAVVVIRNAVDVHEFPQRLSGDALRTELGISTDDIVIGFVGRLAEQKGIRYLLHAAARLSERFHTLRFVIVGGGDLEVELKTQRDRLGLTNVEFVGFQRDTPRYYQMFDIFVLPSLYEGLPVSVLEAMAASLPVVATDVSGTGEAVVDSTTGYLVHPKNILQLEEKLAVLIADPALRKRMGRAGRERVEKLFSASRMVEDTEKLYEEFHLA